MVLINVTHGRDTYDTCRYVLRQCKIDPKKDAVTPDLIMGNMIGVTAGELAAEFKISQSKKPRINVNIARYSVSFPPGEEVDSKTMKRMAWQLICKMGHAPCTQFFAVKHVDEQAKNNVSHFHIVASVVALDGSICKSGWNRLQARRVERELEREFHLIECPTEKPLRRALTTGEYRQRQRLKQPTTKERLWEIIDRAAIDHPNYAEFFRRLHENGVSLKLKQDDKTREILGVSYGFEGMAYGGHRLGSQYTYQGIQEHLGVRMIIDFNELDGAGEVEPKVKKVADMER